MQGEICKYSINGIISETSLWVLHFVWDTDPLVSADVSLGVVSYS